MTTRLLENCTCGKCTPRGSTRGTPAKHVTVEQATAMVKATCERLTALGCATAAEPERAVVGLFLSPRTPDGKAYAANDEYGGVRKAIRVGPKVARQYMPIAKQDAPLERAPDHAPGGTPPGPTAAAELAALKTEAAQLKAAIDDPATGAIDRTRMAMRLSAVRGRIEQLETAATTAPRAGAPATAGQARQFAQPTPHFQLSDVRRSELEAEATALKAKIAAPGLTPGLRLRLEQDLAKIEHLLGLDARPTADPRPSQEKRAQGS